MKQTRDHPVASFPHLFLKTLKTMETSALPPRRCDVIPSLQVAVGKHDNNMC